MQLEATDKPIRYRLRSGEEIVLRPGIPSEVPDQAAQELLLKAAGKVRPVDRSTAEVTIEALRARCPVYWSSGGRIVGPGLVSHVLKCSGHDGIDQFWLLIEFAESWRWVNSTYLRSRQAFEWQTRQACNTCGGRDYWQSVHGASVCRRCHPPADASLVKGESHAG